MNWGRVKGRREIREQKKHRKEKKRKRKRNIEQGTGEREEQL